MSGMSTGPTASSNRRQEPKHISGSSSLMTLCLSDRWVAPHIGQCWVVPQIGQCWVVPHIGQCWVALHIGMCWVTLHIGMCWVVPQIGQCWIAPHIGQCWIAGRHRFRLCGLSNLLEISMEFICCYPSLPASGHPHL